MMHYTPSADDAKFMQEQKFREPNHAYILFRRKFAEVLDPEKKPGHGAYKQGDHMGLRPYEALVTLNVEGCHCQLEKISNRYLTLKKSRVVTWGNFPDKATDQRAKMMVDASGKTPWEKLSEFLSRQVTGAIAQDQKVSHLEAKVAQLEKEAAETKKGKKHDATI